MNINKFKLFCMILFFGCVFAKRISELKCDKMASLNTDPRSLHPHLMEIFEISNQSQLTCPVTLISEHFVLTSLYCILKFKPFNLTNLKIRKLELSEEQYSYISPHFGIKKIMQEERNNRIAWNLIILIKLNEPVPFRNNRSIFRPACLWTSTIDPTGLYSSYGINYNKLNIDPFIISSQQYIESIFTSSGKFSNSMSQLYFNTTLGLNVKLGGPVEVNVRNQTFIFGIITSGTIRMTETIIYKAPKISSFIAWIEATVWPQLTNLECGQRKVKNKPLMTFAQPSYHGEFPWHVAMFRNNRKFICSGTILSRQTILTAANCVHDERGVLPPNRLTIVAGTHNLNEYPIEARAHSVETITVHQNFSRTILENDIALLKLFRLIEFSHYIQPICISNMLNYNNFPIGLVAGWGRDESNQESNVLLQGTFPVRDNFECLHSNRNFFSHYLNDHNYCAGYQNGTNTCLGDSGGGMIIEFESRWFLRGIVSLGVAVQNTNRCDLTELVLFTDVPKLYDWIIEQLEDN